MVVAMLDALQKTINYIRTMYTGIVGELKKCSWPSRQELVESTTVVIISVLLLSGYVWGLDALSGGLISGLNSFAAWLQG